MVILDFPDPQDDLIKRVVALPGETVEMAWPAGLAAEAVQVVRTDREAASCCSMFRSSVEAFRTLPLSCSISD